MSVSHQLLPDWSRHQLADQYRATIRSQARRIGLSDDEADEVAHSQALRLCLEGREAGTDEDVRLKFLTRTKYALIRRKEAMLTEKSIADFRDAFGGEGDGPDEAEDGYILSVFFHRVEPTQENDVFARECLHFLDKLPSHYRRVMRKLAVGFTPMEIAQREQQPLETILNEIRIAREWMQDHVRWGE